MKDTTVVLGGGGVWGVAWMTGLLRGLAESGHDLSTADAFIGTSAGSVVSAQLASGLALPMLYRRMTDPALQPREVAAKLDGLQKLGALMMQPTTDHLARSRQVGAAAMAADAIPYAQRRADIVDRLGLPADARFPAKALTTTAVDCETGELVTFTAASGVGLIDAVAASCSVPGVWPVTPINGRKYMDGGVWKTAENAHLAKGAARVVIISPVGAMSPAGGQLHADIAMLEGDGAKVTLISPDAASMAAQSFGMLDPASRKPAAEAGRAQAPSVADAIRSVLQ